MNHKSKTALRFGVSALIVLLAAGCSLPDNSDAAGHKACEKHGNLVNKFGPIGMAGNALFMCSDGSVRWK